MEEEGKKVGMEGSERKGEVGDGTLCERRSMRRLGASVGLPPPLSSPLSIITTPSSPSSLAYTLSTVTGMSTVPADAATFAAAAPNDRNKFSTLPDIDLSSIDVYETASSPELKPTKHTTTSTRRGGREHDEDEDEEDEDGNAEEGGEDGERRRDAAQRRRRRGDGAMDDDDPTRASIEGGALDAEEARQRFQGSTEMRRQTVARRRPRRQQQRYDDYLDSDVYELEERGGAGGSGMGRGVKETPLARLRRLRIEAKELEEELRSQAAAADERDDEAQQVEEGGDPSKPRRAGAANPTPQVMLSHLRSLASGLDAMDVNGSATGTTPSTTRALEQARTLLASLEKQGKTSSTDKAADQPSTSLTPASPATSSDVARLSTLESRLSLLESIVGSNQGVLEETQSLARPLMPTLARLEHLATLLTQPRHLDAISKRVKLLVADLDRVYEARRKLVVQQTQAQAQQQQAQASGGSGGGGKGETATTTSSSAATPSPATTTSSPLDPITLTKLQDLFHLSQRLQPLLPLAPALLSRLESLSQLHGSAARFADDLETLQRDQTDARERLGAMGRGVEEVRESLRSNAEQARGNLRGVEERLERLSERLRRVDERRRGT